jgi:hypothetical protein
MLSWRHIWLAGLVLLLASCDWVRRGADVEAPPATVSTTPLSAPVGSTTTAPVVPTETVVTTQTTIPNRETANCPVTQPPEPPFTPPPPYSPTAPWPGGFWYGTSLLWTQLPGDGKWSGLPHNADGYTQKVFWWRAGYSWTEDPTPQLTVTGRRLDAPAPPLNASRATNAFAEDIQSAMLVGVDFPTLGCWEITGRVVDQELSFVIWVGP